MGKSILWAKNMDGPDISYHNLQELAAKFPELTDIRVDQLCSSINISAIYTGTTCVLSTLSNQSVKKMHM